MPIYTYRCENCGVQIDRQQSFNDPPLSECPECGFNTLRKVYLPVGIVFKGSGFYATDHRSPSGQSRSSGGEKSSDSKKEPDSQPGAGESKTPTSKPAKAAESSE